MKLTRLLSSASLAILSSWIGSGFISAAETARGTVYVDVNLNQKFDDADKPLPGIRVSNGKDIVKTDDKGEYEIGVSNDDIVFVIKPRGYRTILDEKNLPRFYYIHKPEGSPKNYKFKGVDPTGPLPASIDFALYPQEEPEQFRAVLFGDPQPRNQQEVDWIAHDVVQELVGVDASFGVTLGDIVFDDLSVFDALNKTVAMIGIPWYNVIGNHDINYEAPNDALSDETYESHYGPNYYSFDYGQVHFVVVDDIDWIVPPSVAKGAYKGGIGEEQLQFIKNDLEMIPKEQMVVLMMHIPLTDVVDRKDLYRLIEQRPFCISISGHTHHHEHKFVTKADGWMGAEPHHHIINVTVCGSWWSGAKDERGIPHTQMADGGPNGYSIISFDGTKYVLDYFAAGRDEGYQLQIEIADEIELAKVASTEVFVNVFNGSIKSKVEYSLDGKTWTTMDKTVEADPFYKEVFDRESVLLEKFPEKVPFRKLPEPKGSSHLWKAKLPTDLGVGTYMIHVKTTDMHGREFGSKRVLRVK